MTNRLLTAQEVLDYLDQQIESYCRDNPLSDKQKEQLKEMMVTVLCVSEVKS